jgi:hypothetical protein
LIIVAFGIVAIVSAWSGGRFGDVVARLGPLI